MVNCYRGIKKMILLNIFIYTGFDFGVKLLAVCSGDEIITNISFSNREEYALHNNNYNNN